MTIDEEIAEAEIALHKLQTGSLREEVRYESGHVRFGKADVAELRAHIAQLKAKKDGATTRGAIGFAF